VAFEASTNPDIPPVRQALLGINAHINYDLPQAFLAVMTDDDFRRRRDPGATGRRSCTRRLDLGAARPPGRQKPEAGRGTRRPHNCRSAHDAAEPGRY
jgi:hypothetical protein